MLQFSESQLDAIGGEDRARQVCTAKKLQIGVFFDGTNNNHENIKKGGSDERSYSNGITNVVRLRKLYPNYCIKSENGEEVFKSLYIEGIGTEADRKDSGLGYAFGVGNTGVKERAFDAFRKFKRISESEAYYKITVDIFGFSRGSAAARVFLNSLTKRKFLRSTRPFDTHTINTSSEIIVRFVGLFDTVVSVGLLGVLTESRWTRFLDVDISSGQAQKTYQMTAGNEFRRNFPLTSVLPGGGEEERFYGAHSDIGGSYKNVPHSPIVSKTIYEGISLTRASALKKKERFDSETATYIVNEKKHLADMGFLDPKNEDEYTVYTGEVIAFHVGPFYKDYSFYYETKLNRTISNDLEKAHLRVMHDKARAVGVPLGQIPNEPDYAFSTERFKLDPSPPKYGVLSGEAERTFVNTYVHYSADLAGTFGKLANMPKRDRKRHVNPNSVGIS